MFSDANTCGGTIKKGKMMIKAKLRDALGVGVGQGPGGLTEGNGNTLL